MIITTPDDLYAPFGRRTANYPVTSIVKVGSCVTIKNPYLTVMSMSSSLGRFVDILFFCFGLDIRKAQKVSAPVSEPGR
jgi:hypothetical protein